MDWFTSSFSKFYTQLVTDFYNSTYAAWFQLFSGGYWDSTSVNWDDASTPWDAINSDGGWNEKNNTSWFNRN